MFGFFPSIFPFLLLWCTRWNKSGVGNLSVCSVSNLLQVPKAYWDKVTYLVSHEVFCRNWTRQGWHSAVWSVDPFHIATINILYSFYRCFTETALRKQKIKDNYHNSEGILCVHSLVVIHNAGFLVTLKSSNVMEASKDLLCCSACQAVFYFLTSMRWYNHRARHGSTFCFLSYILLGTCNVFPLRNKFY